jgi:bacterioferritin
LPDCGVGGRITPDGRPAQCRGCTRTGWSIGGVAVNGDPEVLALLNEQLTSELTAINQYFLHAKLQHSWGFLKLAELTRAESFEEMRHAEALTDRILLLDGLPNYQRLFSLRVGQTVREQFEADLAVEVDVLDRLRPGIALCRERGDTSSATLLEAILADEEQHIDYLQTQLRLLDQVGEQLFLAQQLSGQE